MTDPWRRVVSQPRAVTALQRAAARPAHAYLIAGRAAPTTPTLARAFAAALVAPDGDERAVDLVERRLHPDVIEFEPERTVITVDQARDEIIPEDVARPDRGGPQSRGPPRGGASPAGGGERGS